ncbi:DUF2625 family protein [Paenibacillus sp. QZ-Y1]|uniref:DUF2625 family protein n=1 Tax=Paenibacillus sp. QZ-Y1 TaxID=3414511 RepID=UPI003F794BAE
MQTLSVDELVDRENHAWEEVKELLDNGSNPYSHVPAASRKAGEDTLYRLQVSTRSYLGTVAYETGGTLLDHGWITLLGSGGNGIYGSLASWNGFHETLVAQPLKGMLVVAYDAAGGFFALNTGRNDQDGHIYYFAPDTLEWESTELAYSGFINWLANGDLEQFYQTFRWTGWQNDMGELQTGQVYAYYPPLWTQEGGGESSRKAPVTILEAWKAALDGK